MARWLLAPIDHRSEVWRSYKVQRLVVEAPDECEARQQVAKATPRGPAPNPWLDLALTSCEKVDGMSLPAPGRKRE
jgi:hypothetical protein